jgi:hypothetical protein
VDENPYKSPESDPDESLFQPIIDWLKEHEVWEHFLNTLPLTVVTGVFAWGGWGVGMWPFWATFGVWAALWLAVFAFMWIVFIIAFNF